MIGNKTAENIAGEQLLVQFDNINKKTKIKTPKAVNTLTINSSYVKSIPTPLIYHKVYTRIYYKCNRDVINQSPLSCLYISHRNSWQHSLIIFAFRMKTSENSLTCLINLLKSI